MYFDNATTPISKKIDKMILHGRWIGNPSSIHKREKLNQL